jgi:hypothetical protein
LIYRIKNKIRRILFTEQWSLLICDKAGTILKHLKPPDNCIWADPFPVEHEGAAYIFIEQQLGNGNGTLGFLELSGALEHSPFTPILERGYHLSYPYIFSVNHNDKHTWYLVPESHEHKTIDLYRAEEFPRRWTHECTLLDNIDASDSSVFFYNGLWWLFTSIGSGLKQKNSNLSLFFSDHFPSRSWKAHPLNPVCRDPSNSRMAGSLFIEDGVLYRPAQDCKQDYGQKININTVTTLDKESYSEKTVKTINPEKSLGAVCTHTINYASSFMLRDIKTRSLRRFA